MRNSIECAISIPFINFRFYKSNGFVSVASDHTCNYVFQKYIKEDIQRLQSDRKACRGRDVLE